MIRRTFRATRIPGAPIKSSGPCLAITCSRSILAGALWAHLGSVESDVDVIAWRLDRHRDFAVDTAARVRHLTFQPRAKVRAFFIKYQDRVFYGTDSDIIPPSDLIPVTALRKLYHDNAVRWMPGLATGDLH